MLIEHLLNSLDTILLCNKTSRGPGFSKTEIQALNTRVQRLEKGDCGSLEQDGFRCIEHYQCVGEDVELVTDGESETRSLRYKTF